MITPVRANDLIEELCDEDCVLEEDRLVKLLHAIIKWNEEGIVSLDSILFVSFFTFFIYSLTECIRFSSVKINQI